MGKQANHAQLAVAEASQGVCLRARDKHDVSCITVIMAESKGRVGGVSMERIMSQ